MMSIQSVVIIGSGNVATHLGKAIKAAGFTVNSIYSRDHQKAAELAKQLGADPYSDLKLLPADAGLYIIAVKDAAIQNVANELPETAGLVVHTSGTTPMSVLSMHKRTGVFYPLQSLSKNTAISIKDIPLLLEASTAEDLNVLEQFAQQCGSKPVAVNSENRQVVHLAAVFANNFSNYLYIVAEQILGSKGLSIDMLKPLIMETAHKIQDHKPLDMQTGPAVRNDRPTMEMHLKLMEQMPQYRQIYELLSKGIHDSQADSR